MLGRFIGQDNCRCIREAAVHYKKHIDAALIKALKRLKEHNPRKLDLDLLQSLQTDVIISGSPNDTPALKAFTDSSKHETSIKRFKMAFSSEEDGVTGNIGILIVNNMLLTGFDAPVEQVMYLDKTITEHNLLQAIARVNRVAGPEKDKGLVVDYVGVGYHLKQAIDCYDEREQKEILEALSSPQEELSKLTDSRDAVINFLKEHGITDFTDLDAFYDLFYDEDIRFTYMKKFRELTKSLNLVFPNPQALEYMNEYQVLTEINVMASKHLRDQRLSMKGIPAKLRAIIDDYLISKGIEQTVEPISILDVDFQKQVNMHSRTKTKAAEIEHAIRHHLEVELDNDPELQTTFSEMLAAILEQFRNNWQTIFVELEKLRAEIKKASKEPSYGLHRKKEMPFFRMFKRELFNESELGEDAIALLVTLTQQIFFIVERELKLQGFWESIPARNKLKAEVQKTLVANEFSSLPDIFNKRSHILSQIMEISEKTNDTILYAE